MPEKLRVLDLFSGIPIGGFSLGLDRAGFETVAFCEANPYCQKVLAKHWPGIPIHDDIRTLDGEQYRGTVELVCGGFPCQPFSQAGKRAGKDDDRDLWPEMFRVIREIQPAWIIGENVAGFVNMELDRTLSDLEGEGYACQTFDIPACGVDAPHLRHRVWVVANSGRPGRREDARGPYEDESEYEGRRETQTNLVASDGQRGHAGNVGNTASKRRGETRSKSERSEERTASSGNVGDTNNAGCSEQRLEKPTRAQHAALERTSRWEPEPAVGRVAHGIPGRAHRLRALGNAVVPQIPELIGRAILATQSNTPNGKVNA